ncbi:ly6/PLAUR domain-containing protein 8 [Octodon degus]|uniref:Ly6/PLAUR domain-containing protein 8 n=1 Tax=Octodon degus TaxID=10160 RepID=A0A6P6DAP5_OCTDE|nr:ly6/PLAUR domain-containing protein 8 [Octodon degus]
MRGLLAALLISALASPVVESLNCVQCNSFTKPCANVSASECPLEEAHSCVSSWSNSLLGGTLSLYEDMSCSAANCSGDPDAFLSFTVRVSDTEHFDFASQCCQGKTCNTTDSTSDSPQEDLSDTQCLACYGWNTTSCTGKPWKCYKGERCVYLIAQFKNATETLVLKGCSNIGTSTCELLSARNETFEGLALQKIECTDATPIALPSPGSRTFPGPLALTSLLLLGLLL